MHIKHQAVHSGGGTQDKDFKVQYVAYMGGLVFCDYLLTFLPHAHISKDVSGICNRIHPFFFVLYYYLCVTKTCLAKFLHPRQMSPN